MEAFRSQIFLITEAFHWACASVQDKHDWDSEFSLVVHENKKFLNKIATLKFHALCSGGHCGTPRPAVQTTIC